MTDAPDWFPSDILAQQGASVNFSVVLTFPVSTAGGTIIAATAGKSIRVVNLIVSYNGTGQSPVTFALKDGADVVGFGEVQPGGVVTPIIYPGLPVSPGVPLTVVGGGVWADGNLQFSGQYVLV